MADGQKRDEMRSQEELDLEALKRERVRKSNRDYYQRNKHWLLPEAQERREAARRRRNRRRCGRKPKPTPEQLREAAEAQAAALERQREEEEWNDLGWVVAKMNKSAKMNQEQIYELLAGLATKQKIAKWCAKGRKLDRIEPTQGLP